MKKCFITITAFILALTMMSCKETQNNEVSPKKPTNVGVTGMITTPLPMETSRITRATEPEIPTGFSEIKGNGTIIISKKIMSMSPQEDIDGIISEIIDFYNLPLSYEKVEYNPNAYGIDFGYIEKYDSRIVVDVLVDGINLNALDKDYKLPTEK